MFRRSLVRLAKESKSRTIVRDPRKVATKIKSSQPLAVVPDNSNTEVQQYSQQQTQQPLPFVAPPEHHQSFASSLGSYAVLGAGVTMGFMLVRVILGG